MRLENERFYSNLICKQLRTQHHKNLLKITLRCYFIRNYSKSHRVAISMKVHVRSKIQRVLKYNSIATSLPKIAKFKTNYLKNVLYFLSMNTSTHVSR